MQILPYSPYSGAYASPFTSQQFNPWLSSYNYGGVQYPFNVIQGTLPDYQYRNQYYQDPAPSFMLPNYVILITLHSYYFKYHNIF